METGVDKSSIRLSAGIVVNRCDERGGRTDITETPCYLC